MSAVPVALPVMFTVSMAVGSKELAKRGVLVTRLSAAEDAATMDVLCVDKTGTITMNQLAVGGRHPAGEATEADVLVAGALASQEANQDPIDLAFLAAAKDRHALDNGTEGDADLLRAVRRREPSDRSDRGTGREEVPGDEGRGAHHRRGLRVPTSGDRRAGGAGRRIGRQGLPDTGRGTGPRIGAPGFVGAGVPGRSAAARCQGACLHLRGLGVGVKMLTGDALAVARKSRRAWGCRTSAAWPT